VSLTSAQLPLHDHAAVASTAVGSWTNPAGRVPARDAAGVPQYGVAPDTQLSPGALLPAGASVQHNNMQPYLAINYIISLFGEFPLP
jgi:microcystin-dependent protein